MFFSFFVLYGICCYIPWPYHPDGITRKSSCRLSRALSVPYMVIHRDLYHTSHNSCVCPTNYHVQYIVFKDDLHRFPGWYPEDIAN